MSIALQSIKKPRPCTTIWRPYTYRITFVENDLLFEKTINGYYVISETGRPPALSGLFKARSVFGSVFKSAPARAAGHVRQVVPFSHLFTAGVVTPR
jgi:hypothetical protein